MSSPTPSASVYPQTFTLGPIVHQLNVTFPTEFRVYHRLELDPAIVALLNRLLSNVGGNFPSRISALEAKVSQLSDAIAALVKSADDAIARVQTDVNALNAKVAELQAKVDAGLATPEDIASLEAAKAKLDALDPTKEATLPVDGGGPPTPPPVAPPIGPV